MKDNRLNKAIEDIQSIRMTSGEKQAVLDRVLGAPQPRKSVESPWAWSVFMQKNIAQFSITVAVALLLGGNGAVQAAEMALPGDALYKVKIGLIEPVRVFLAGGSVARAQAEAALVTRRVAEAQKLSEEGKLDVSKEATINSLIDTHMAELTQTLDTVSKGKMPDQAQKISAPVEASLRDHAQLLHRPDHSDKKAQNFHQDKKQDRKDAQPQNTQTPQTLEPVPIIDSVQKKADVGRSDAGASVNASVNSFNNNAAAVGASQHESRHQDAPSPSPQSHGEGHGREGKGKKQN